MLTIMKINLIKVILTGVKISWERKMTDIGKPIHIFRQDPGCGLLDFLRCGW